MVSIAGFGDSVVDVFPSKRLEYPGGNCANVAVIAARLGASTAYVGVVGSDNRGARIVQALFSCKVDVSRVAVRAGETGWTAIDIVNGDRVFVANNSWGVTRSQPAKLDAETLDFLSHFDAVHSSVYSAVETQLPLLPERAHVSYDFSSNPEYRTDDYLREVCPHIDLAQFSCADSTLLETQLLLSRAVDFGAGRALATLGAEGALLRDGKEEITQAAVPIPAERSIIDTTGCGDAFIAAFLVSLLGVRAARATPSDLQGAMRSGADAAYEQCFVSGGFGQPWPLLTPTAAAHRDAQPEPSFSPATP